MTPENARIASTMLGREDHGIPTCMLHLDFGGSAQGFGGYDLRAWGIDFITKIIDGVGVDRWEHLPGKYVRVQINSDRRSIDGIGHIVEDRWFRPRDNPPSTVGRAG